MSLSKQELTRGLRSLQLGQVPVIIHASLRSFGEVLGGPATVVSALLDSFASILVPTFTYKTMVTPGVGPENNAIIYGSGMDANRMAEFFHPELPADPLIGIIPETLRRHPAASRSFHPILSFAGIHADPYLSAQTMTDPLEPLAALERDSGWVLLLGVNHTVNTSIHCAEKLTGRMTFTRWALTPIGVRECPSFPGCSFGFEAVASHLETHTRSTRIAQAFVQAMPLQTLFTVVTRMIHQDPLALLCQREDCERCNQVRMLG